MKPETHLENFKTHKSVIFDWAVAIKGPKERQRIVGLHASRGIVELLSVFLHENGLLSSGAQLNHRWFKSKSVEKRLPEFKNKTKIVLKLTKLENLCETLSYGGEKPEERTNEAIELFKNLEEEIEELRKNE